MKLGKLLYCSPLMAAVMMLHSGTVLFAADKEPEQTRQLMTAAANGPEPLFQYIRQTKAKAPLIYSQWYVDRLKMKDAEKGKIEQAHRDFGQKFLEVLEVTAPALRKPADAQARQSKATMLLNLADWFGEPAGYGNAYIFDRLQDMATIPIAYLIADLSYPEKYLAVMMKRLVDYPEDVKRNIRVLNIESPEPVFDVQLAIPSAAEMETMKNPSADASRILDPLRSIWSGKARDIQKWRQEHDRPFDWDRKGKKLRDELPENLVFFVDDDASSNQRPLTSLTRYSGKFHQRLLLGQVSHNIGNLKHFLFFRQKIGKFPTKLPSWWKAGDTHFLTPTDAAFDMAWEPYRTEYGPIYDAAARIYNAVQSNTFYDEDTREIRSFGSRKDALLNR
jgi:hypothetical protein